VKVPDHNVRHYVGLARKHTSHLLRQLNLLPPGGIWARRCKPIPITSRLHQVKVVGYILKHEKRGAAICAMNANPHARPAPRGPGRPRQGRRADSHRPRH
jgi:hypothetical protein